MPLEFKGNSICLSGKYGTKLKTHIVNKYYRFWLEVTSGGKTMDYSRPTVIVDMNAGTGMIYLEDLDEHILGSAGHALDLCYGSGKDQFKRLHVGLVEPDVDCRPRLLKTVEENWPEVNLRPDTKGAYTSKDGRVVLFTSQTDFMRYTGDGAMNTITLFYYDPLRATEWSIIDRIAQTRITTPYRIGTEFIVFFFTSDWVKGRTTFAPLPRHKDEHDWTDFEMDSVLMADEAFGGRIWLEVMTSGDADDEIERQLVTLYKSRLRKWFRFVQNLPFVPESGERYDLFCCSNYDVGARVLTGLYEKETYRFGVQEPANDIYPVFKARHPDIVAPYKGSSRPPIWKVLWHVMKNHTDGVCDEKCIKLKEKTKGSKETLRSVLLKLHDLGYIKVDSREEWPWTQPRFLTYEVDWDVVHDKLGVQEPGEPRPLRPDD